MIYNIGAKGTKIKEMQSTLNKIGYNVGDIDGVYGNQTSQAVKRFQLDFKLLPTGIVDESTYKVLESFMKGYDIYRVRKGDTLYKIANMYKTNMNSIFTANPDVNPNSMQIGREIVVPYSMDVVCTNIDYTYDVMMKDIKGLKARYPFIELGSSGKSWLGRELYYVKLGKGDNKIFYNAAHHSLEWITAVLMMKFIEDYCRAYAEKTDLRGYDVDKLWNKTSIYIVPMVNPDGIDLVLNGLSKDNPYYDKLIEWNKGSTDFSKVWQANVRGVDLNHNYDASWKKSKEAEAQYDIVGPGPTRYSGTKPESEKESKAVADFTRENLFKMVLAYHSQGEVIYWNYNNLATERDRRIGERFEAVSGYKMSETTGITSYAGYKDWFIERYRKPGYTIEVGIGTNPLPIEQFNKIYKDNIGILLEAANIDIEKI